MTNSDMPMTTQTDRPEESRRDRPTAYLLLASAIAGAAVMALEVLAGRTMAPAIGTGSAAWSALLAVALGSLAAGNLLGGLLASRASAGAIACWALTMTAVAAVAFATSYKPVMHWASELGVVQGAIAAAMAGQSVPMLLLGAVSPAIVAAARTGRSSGRWAGAVLASGSAGGIIGALAVGLAALPALGIGRSYIAVAGVMGLAAVPMILRHKRWLCGLVVMLVLAGAGWQWRAMAEPTVIHSALGQIEVRQGPDGCLLLIDGLPQSAWREPLQQWDGLRHGYLLEAALLLAPRTRDALVIGLGAGLAPRLLEAHGVRCQSVELDAAVADVARRELGFTGSVTVADGRAYLARTDAEWDLIVLDVCTSDRLAMHLFTVESMRLLKRRLSPGGVLAVQFIGDDGKWSASLDTTVRHVFGQALVLAPQADIGVVGPRWLFAGNRSLPPPEVLDAPGSKPPWLVVQSDGPGRLLTDDHFPAETAWARVAHIWRRSYGQ